MVSRRRILRIAAAGLAAAAGCAGSSPSGSRSRTPGSTPTPARTPTPTPRSTPSNGADEASDSPTESATPGAFDPPEWTPSWQLAVPERHVLGLNPVGDRLYAVASDEGGPSAVSAVDPSARDVDWRAELDGEAVEESHAGASRGAAADWGVTVTSGRVYAVTGTADSYGWTAAHALDRETGDRRWSFRKKRRLAIRGVLDGTVFATGLEFFEPEHSHDTPEEPLTTALYALDGDGTARWSRTFAAVEDVAVGSDAVYVVAGGDLIALGSDGSERFSFERGGPGRSVRVASDRIYYATETGDDRSTVHGLTSSGGRDWTRTLPASEFAVAGGPLYAADEAVAALAPDGAVAWRDDAWGRWLLFGPDRETLYTRAGRGADAVSAYETAGGRKRWTFDPPFSDAWPAAATDDAAVAQAITADDADDAFYTLYAVDGDDGTATAGFARDSVITVESLGGTVFVGDGESTITALEP